MPGQSVIESKLPVFTTPQQQITFYADDPLTFKQILTIYNPYDFLIKFRITCTDCSKYTVSASQGSIKSNHSIDIVVHHKAVCPNNIGVADTVRIQLYTSGQVRAGGKKDLAITLVGTAPRERVPAPFIDPRRFQTLDSDSSNLGDSRQSPLLQEQNKSKFLLTAIVVGVCAIVLTLPLEGGTSSWNEYAYIPQVACAYKVCAGFILGMIVASTLIKT